jgi:hypothetical protein
MNKNQVKKAIGGSVANGAPHGLGLGGTSGILGGPPPSFSSRDVRSNPRTLKEFLENAAAAHERRYIKRRLTVEEKTSFALLENEHEPADCAHVLEDPTPSENREAPSKKTKGAKTSFFLVLAFITIFTSLVMAAVVL